MGYIKGLSNLLVEEIVRSVTDVDVQDIDSIENGKAPPGMNHDEGEARKDQRAPKAADEVKIHDGRDQYLHDGHGEDFHDIPVHNQAIVQNSKQAPSKPNHKWKTGRERA